MDEAAKEEAVAEKTDENVTKSDQQGEKITNVSFESMEDFGVQMSNMIFNASYENESFDDY